MLSNTFGTRKLLFLILVLIATDLAIFFNVPALRQFLGFSFFTIAPGFLIVYLMKLNRLALAEQIVLAVGLSVAFIMFYGLLVNSLLLAVGYRAPLATVPLLISFSLAVIGLAIGAYLRNRNIELPVTDLRLTTREKALLAIPALFPVLSIVGTRLMNLTENNALLLVMLSLIVVYVLFVSVYHRQVPERLYPAIIFFISISLVLMYALRSNHIIGSDTHLEYYAFQVTSGRLHWAIGVAGGALDVVLAVSILSTVYQSFLNIDPEYLFKILYPLIVSILPVVVYLLSRKYLGSFYAFLAAMFLMSQNVFQWTEAEVRSNTAIMFLALAFLVLFHDGIGEFKKRVLYIIFTAATLASHYSTSYIYLFVSLFAWVLMELSSLVVSPQKAAARASSLKRVLTFSSVALFSVMLFLWYSQATGVAFKDGVHVFRRVVSGLNEFFLAESRGTGVRQVVFGYVPSYTEAALLRIEVVFTWLTILFIAIGVFRTLIGLRAMVATPVSLKGNPDFLSRKLDPDFFTLSVASAVLLVVAVTLPYVTIEYGMGRTYFLAMVPLSTFFVIGGITVARFLKLPPRLLACLIVILYFMSTSGLTYQLFGFPRSVTLNASGYFYDTMYVHDQETFAAKWLGEKRISTVGIFSERIRLLESQGGIMPEDVKGLVPAYQSGGILSGYVFLRYLNVVQDQYTGGDQLRHSLSQATPNLFADRIKLYTNGGAEVYY